MSWFYLIKGNINSGFLKRISGMFSNTEIKVREENLILATGGDGDNLIIDLNLKIIAAGVPVVTHKNNYRFAEAEDIDLCFSKNDPNIIPEGHFAALKLSESDIYAVSDRLGIKEYYYAKSDNSIIISTRVDLISKSTGGADIDFQNMGSRWLLNSQFGRNSIFKNIRRVSSAFIRIDKDLNVKRKDISFIPEFRNNVKPDDFKDEIRKCINLTHLSGKKTIFAMSGGIDSRFLFSLIENPDDLILMNDADKNHPDYIIANKISKHFKLPLIELADYDSETGYDQDELSDYILFTQLIAKVSAFAQKRRLKYLDASGSIVLDGSFGEEGRRGYYKKMEFKAGRKFSAANSDYLMETVRTGRYLFFNEEINRQLEVGAKQDFKTAVEEAEKNKADYNVYDWLAFRNRLPNNRFDIARFDQFVMNLEPFSFSRVIQASVNMDIMFRENAFMYKNSIRRSHKFLSKLPFVKGDLIYPFRFNYKMSAVWMKLQRRSKKKQYSLNADKYLKTYSGLIGNLLNDPKSFDSGIYNEEMVRKHTGDFLNGNLNFYSFTDDWLTFELFRRKVSDSSSV